MASKTNMSTSNQGPRLGKASTRGKVSGNSLKPKLKANIKLSQGVGRGVRQGKGGAKYVASARPGTGLRQSGTTAKKPAATKVGVNKLNKAPMAAQPKYAKKNSNNLVLHNSVSKGDVARLRKAHNLATPPMTGGGFKAYIGGK